jgi:hypothetical protein
MNSKKIIQMINVVFFSLQTMEKLGHTGTVKEFFNSLVNDSRFYSNDTVRSFIIDRGSQT